MPGIEEETCPMSATMQRSTLTVADLKQPVARAQPGNSGATLTARALKCTAVLDPAALIMVSVPDGVSRVTLKVSIDKRTVTASIAAKSLRRAIATIQETGAENVALILQGKLVGETIEEAGLSAMPKAPRT
jgi:hypothetical protein